MSLIIQFLAHVFAYFPQEKTVDVMVAQTALEKAVAIISAQSPNSEDYLDLKAELVGEIMKLRCAHTMIDLEKTLHVLLPRELHSDKLLSSPKELTHSLLEFAVELSWAAQLEHIRCGESLYIKNVNIDNCVMHIFLFI